MEWTDEWPEAFKLACPDCGTPVEAYATLEIDPRAGVRKAVADFSQAASKFSRSLPD